MTERERGRRALARSGASWGADATSGAGRAPPGGGDPHPFAIDEATRYQPVAELGQGGMGQVVSVLDRRLRRQVALKRVAAGARGQAGSAAEASAASAAGVAGSANRRFAREAWITAALDHPAIVPVFDAGLGADGSLYYTMRLIRGRTLGTAIRDAGALVGRLSLLRRFLQACEAVAYAHSQGVVHRDLKPDNILVAEFGETQVVDWGVARHLRGEDDEASPALADPGLTAAGAVIGTPAYMSPEQAEGAPPDPRADVYSLGVVLYEIVTGHPPCLVRGPQRGPGDRAADADAVLAALRTQAPPSVAAAQPGVPPELTAIIDHCLRRDPAARYPDAAALAADVARYLDGRRVAAHRYSLAQELLRWARARRAPLGVAGVALLLLLALGLWAVARTRAERDRAVAAERQARGALAVADRSLARALVEQALDAQAEDAQPEAEVLAANALTLAESPDARGVLAAFAFAGRPLLRERLFLPRCAVARPRSDGAVLCVGEGEVALYEGRPLALRWRQPLRADDAVWLSRERTIAAAVEDNHVILLDAADGRVRGDLGGGLAWRSFTDAGAGPLAVLLNSGRVSIVDDEAKVLRKVAPCAGEAEHLAAAVSTRGARVAVGCHDGTVAILGADGALLARHQTGFHGRRAGISAVGLSSDGALLVVASLAGDLLTLDLPAGRERARRRTALGIVRTMTFAPDDGRVALLGEHGGVSLWDPRSWALLRRLPAQRDQALAFGRDGAELFTTGTWLRRWAFPGRPLALRPMEARLPGLAAADLSPAGDRLALAAGDGSLVVLDGHDGQRLLVDRFQEGVLKGARLLGDGGVLAWAAGRPSLRRYDAAGRPRWTLDLGLLRRAALLASGWLVAVDYGLGLALVGPGPRGLASPGGAPPDVVRVGEQLFGDADVSVDQRVALALEEGGGVWQVEDGDPPRARRLLVHADAEAVALSGDASTLAVADLGGVTVRDRRSGALRARCRAEGRRILDVALSRDGALVAAGDYDRAARVWSARDGRLLAVLRGHEGRVSGVRFSADGRLLLTASWDGSARLWDTTVLTRPAEPLQRETEAAWGLDLDAVSQARLR